MATIRGTHLTTMITDDLWQMYEGFWVVGEEEEDYREADTLGWPVIETERQVCAVIRFIEHPEVLAQCWWMPDDEDLDIDWNELASRSWITRLLMNEGSTAAYLMSTGRYENTVEQAYTRGMPR